MTATTLILFIYFADVLPSLGGALIAFPTLFLTIYIIISSINEASESYGSAKTVKIKNILPSGKVLIVCILSITIGILIPSEKTIYMMGGVGVGSKVIDDVSKSERFEKVMTIIDYKLDEIIEEAKEKEKEK